MMIKIFYENLQKQKLKSSINREKSHMKSRFVFKNRTMVLQYDVHLSFMTYNTIECERRLEPSREIAMHAVPRNISRNLAAYMSRVMLCCSKFSRNNYKFSSRITMMKNKNYSNNK